MNTISAPRQYYLGPTYDTTIDPTQILSLLRYFPLVLPPLPLFPVFSSHANAVASKALPPLALPSLHFYFYPAQNLFLCLKPTLSQLNPLPFSLCLSISRLRHSLPLPQQIGSKGAAVEGVKQDPPSTLWSSDSMMAPSLPTISVSCA